MSPNRTISLAVVSVAVFLAGIGAGGCGRQEPPGAVETKAALKTVLIPVEGMSCMVCATRVKKALSSLEGVSDAEVNLGDRQARVRFDPAKVSPERLASTVGGLGYRAGTPKEAP